MPKYRITETYTSDDPRADRSRASAIFETDHTDPYEVAIQGVLSLRDSWTRQNVENFWEGDVTAEELREEFGEEPYCSEFRVFTNNGHFDFDISKYDEKDDHNYQVTIYLRNTAKDFDREAFHNELRALLVDYHNNYVIEWPVINEYNAR